jgi:hypothetical protein
MSSSYIKTTRSNIEFNLSDNDPKSNTVSINQLEDISENAGDGLVISSGSDNSGQRIIIPSTDNNILIGRNSTSNGLLGELSNYTDTVFIHQGNDNGSSSIIVDSSNVNLYSGLNIDISSIESRIQLDSNLIFNTNGIISFNGDISNDDELIIQGGGLLTMCNNLDLYGTGTFNSINTFKSNVNFSNSILLFDSASRIRSDSSTSITASNAVTINGGPVVGNNRVRISGSGVELKGDVIVSNETTFESRVDLSALVVSNDVSFNKDLYIASNLNISGNVVTDNIGTFDICGDLTLWGDTIFKSISEFSNDVTFGSNLILNSATTTLSGTTINVDGDTEVNLAGSNSNVLLTVNSNGVTISGELNVVSAATFSNSVSVSNGLTVETSGGLFKNDVEIQGDLTVTGTTTTTTTVLNDLDISDNKIRLNYNEVSATVRDSGIIFNNVSSTSDVSTSAFFYETDGGSNTFILGFIDLLTLGDNFPLITPSGDDMDKYCDLILKNLDAKEVNLVSDRRLKNNIKPIINSKEIISELNPVIFNWKNHNINENNNENIEYGFIAQEVEEILPQIVKERGDGYKGVAYQKLIPIMVDYIKKQNEKIESLEKIVNDQSDEISNIKSLIQKVTNKYNVEL